MTAICFRSPRRRLGSLASAAIPLLALVLLMPAAPTSADVKLITLPVRERVEIQLDHPNVTLVEEERIVPLSAGVNDVVFAWTNTRIDPASVQFRCLTDDVDIAVLSTSYPPNQTALTWQVAAAAPVSARVRISYLLGRLDKTHAYKAVASHDESRLTLWQYVRLHNQANESFGEAGMTTRFGERIERPLGIDETRQLLVRPMNDVAVSKTYTADLAQYGYIDQGKRQLRVPMHYCIANDDESGLGETPLPAGKIRIFQDDGRGTTAFIGEDVASFTPRDDEMNLYLGVAQDIVVTRTIERVERIDRFGNLRDYDVVVKYEIENFKDQAVTLTLAESMNALRGEAIGHTGRQPDWIILPGGSLRDMVMDRSTADRPVFTVDLPARHADTQEAKTITKTLAVRFRSEW